MVIQAHLKTLETRQAPEARYQAKLALAKGLYRLGWGRGNILELFRFIDWMLRLPEELEHRLLSETQTYEDVNIMTYVTSVERNGIRMGIEQGMQEGMQQGLQHERLPLLRQARKRFGDEIASRSAPLLDQVTSYQALEDLAEAIMDCSDGESWIQRVSEAAG